MGQKGADALIGMASQTLQAGGLPTVHGVVPTLSMHVTDTDSPPVIDGAGAVSDQTAEQLLCEAEKACVRETRNASVLDANPRRRDPTPQQRIAVIARDRTGNGPTLTAGTRRRRTTLTHHPGHAGAPPVPTARSGAGREAR